MAIVCVCSVRKDEGMPTAKREGGARVDRRVGTEEGNCDDGVDGNTVAVVCASATTRM